MNGTFTEHIALLAQPLQEHHSFLFFLVLKGQLGEEEERKELVRRKQEVPCKLFWIFFLSMNTDLKSLGS